MKRRVIRLLKKGVPPENLLVVTFTRVAAKDLQDELSSMEIHGAEQLRATTLHALALQMLGNQKIRATISRSERIISSFEYAPMVEDLKRQGRGKRQVEMMLNAYEGSWARLQFDQPRSADSTEEREFEHDLQSWLEFHDAMLIGEVIPRLYRHLASIQSLSVAHKYSHVFVDEFQDLNKAEQCLIDLISGEADTLIVGDEDQSIYGFKYAHPEGIRYWRQNCAGVEDAELVDCHRCPEVVVNAANKLIAANPRNDRTPLIPLRKTGKGEAHVWQFWMPIHEAKHIKLEIEHLVDQGVKPEEILVLARDNRYGAEILDVLESSLVPIESFLSGDSITSNEFQRRMELIALAANKNDRVALRWLLGQGSGNWNKGTFARFRSSCARFPQKTPWQLLEEHANGDSEYGFSQPTIGKFEAIRSEIAQISQATDMRELVDWLFSDCDSVTSQIRELILEEIEDSNFQHNIDSLNAAIRRAIEVPEDRRSHGAVRLMTLHKSKGLSAPYTFVVGCIDGIVPFRGAQQLEEERRLLYVGISRVKSDLENGNPGVLVLSYPIRVGRQMAEAYSVQRSAERDSSGLTSTRVSPFLSELGLRTTHKFYPKSDRGTLLNRLV